MNSLFFVLVIGLSLKDYQSPNGGQSGFSVITDLNLPVENLNGFSKTNQTDENGTTPCKKFITNYNLQIRLMSLKEIERLLGFSFTHKAQLDLLTALKKYQNLIVR